MNNVNRLWPIGGQLISAEFERIFVGIESPKHVTVGEVFVVKASRIRWTPTQTVFAGTQVTAERAMVKYTCLVGLLPRRWMLAWTIDEKGGAEITKKLYHVKSWLGIRGPLSRNIGWWRSTQILSPDWQLPQLRRNSAIFRSTTIMCLYKLSTVRPGHRPCYPPACIQYPLSQDFSWPSSLSSFDFVCNGNFAAYAVRKGNWIEVIWLFFLFFLARLAEL